MVVTTYALIRANLSSATQNVEPALPVLHLLWSSFNLLGARTGKVALAECQGWKPTAAIPSVAWLHW